MSGISNKSDSDQFFMQNARRIGNNSQPTAVSRKKNLEEPRLDQSALRFVFVAVINTAYPKIGAY